MTVAPRGTSSSSSTNTAPLALQVVDDEPVVHDLVAHVDRRAELRERLLDDRDRAIDAGAEAARIGEQDLHVSDSFGRPPARRCRCAEAVEDQQRRADGDRAVGDVERRLVPVARSGTAGSRPRGRAPGGRRGCRARRRGSARGRRSTARLPPRRSSHTMTTPAAIAIAANNQRCQPPAPARKLNAAPVLYASTRLKKRRDRHVLAIAERRDDRAPWSAGRATITATASHSQRSQRGRRCDRRHHARAGHANARGSPAPNRFATQRPHSVGCAASAPTSARQCQQRSHFGVRARRRRRSTSASPARHASPPT